MASPRSIQEFIERRAPSGGAERSNYALFLAELCEQLGVEPPQPAVQDEAKNAYVVDRSVTFLNADGTKSPGAREERSGIVRWLRPSYQHPKAFRQEVLDTDEGQATATTPTNTAKVKWPPTLAEQAKAVREALLAENAVLTSQDLAKAFTGARVERVTELLETLVPLGQARQLEDGRYTT